MSCAFKERDTPRQFNVAAFSGRSSRSVTPASSNEPSTLCLTLSLYKSYSVIKSPINDSHTKRTKGFGGFSSASGQQRYTVTGFLEKSKSLVVKSHPSKVGT